MRVNLIKKQTIEDYVAGHARSKSSFRTWLTIIKTVEWETPNDITNTFGAADLLGNGSNRVVFNIGGNNYRMICKYLFGEKDITLFVCWIGTHAEYDRVCADGRQYDVSDY